LSCNTFIGSDRLAVYCVQAMAPPISQREPSPFSGLPCSAVRSWASSSACCSIFSAILRQAVWRLRSVSSRQGLLPNTSTGNLGFRVARAA